jgi:hypothetical protein
MYTIPNMNKNIEKLESFTEYCKKNPDQRFWQALRNWAATNEGPEHDVDINFIYAGDLSGEKTIDTFYWN